eukprot:CAMPEP_0202726044 /NCGR_PEP_ID=MMETSP1385-20130828/184413_1 /ASSEMBLY_ACC=CAM_ASM_000861 /TAXON_ID=933848 /ORGANISM="Elphidium margaritaceum" /LENGTH=459 /DNA_ID=CAMNT_0049392257 /DNA_START=89 /DNA_END=1469 /DNA_ORIENTATION=+
MHDMNTGFPSFSTTDEKSKSASPLQISNTRTVFRAKRRGPCLERLMDDDYDEVQPMAIHSAESEHDAKFEKMSDEQYKQYQQHSMPHRMKRKRKFDVFSSGSNDALHSILQNASPFRVAYHCMFYARVNGNSNNTNNCNQNQQNATQNPNTCTTQAQLQSAATAECEAKQAAAAADNAEPRNAFALLLHSSKCMQDWNAAAMQLQRDDDDDGDDDNDTDMQHPSTSDNHHDEGCDAAMQELMAQHHMGDSRVTCPVSEECLITRSVRVQSEWVEAYLRYEDANNTAWRQLYRHGKIHEYKINRAHGIILLNLNACEPSTIGMGEAYLRYEDANNTAWRQLYRHGKIHEYKINRAHGIILLNLNACESSSEQQQQQQIQPHNLTDAFIQQNERNIKQWVLDHGYSGFIWKACYCLYQPHLYWNLLDDDKTDKVKQTLISDIFKSCKTKSTKNPWKRTFAM